MVDQNSSWAGNAQQQQQRWKLKILTFSQPQPHRPRSGFDTPTTACLATRKPAEKGVHRHIRAPNPLCDPRDLGTAQNLRKKGLKVTARGEEAHGGAHVVTAPADGMCGNRIGWLWRNPRQGRCDRGAWHPGSRVATALAYPHRTSVPQFVPNVPSSFPILFLLFPRCSPVAK